MKYFIKYMIITCKRIVSSISVLAYCFEKYQVQQEYLCATGPGASLLMDVQNFTGMNNCSEVKRAVDGIIYKFKCL